ncbi:MAG: peptide chain release factor 1 [Rhodobiaceae bacterium]|nr:peptide chain release factor 1 [Rhodobiaceae bacterium]MBT6222596.1 peptide chain release factor 1 [Rhodobiaceae bacterium]
MLNERKLEALVSKFNDIQVKMVSSTENASIYVSLAKEYAELEPIVLLINDYLRLKKEILDLQSIIASLENDKAMLDMTEEEIREINKSLLFVELEIEKALIPKDIDDQKSVIIEIRAGTGGNEAALFAGDLARMYLRFADLNSWKVEVMNVNDGDMGGYKEFIASIIGNNVYQKLKFESGVHRVQRVPQTESSGRIHTSAATVAVLPEAEEVDIKIEDKDIRIDVFRASGPGGQSVNTTDSAIRITHLLTGITVSQQDEKSQHKNREKGMKVLRARLYEREKMIKDKERAKERKGQIGSGDRSERIRTYNFPQGRITDHRINLTLHKLDTVLEGSGLYELVETLLSEDQVRRMADNSGID